jgi:uncharacterized membrane protein YgdD (TMEM256/DUF423 family)
LKPELVFVVVDVLMRSSELMSFSGVFPISGKIAFSGKIFRKNSFFRKNFPENPKTPELEPKNPVFRNF